MATPKKTCAAKAVAPLSADAPVPEPVQTEVIPFIPSPVTLPPMDVLDFVTKNLSAAGYTDVVVTCETTEDGKLSLNVAGRNSLSAFCSCTPKFAPEQFNTAVFQATKAMVDASLWADPRTNIIVTPGPV
jgi:hypothetical protein